MKKFISYIVLICFSLLSHAQDLTGTWSGSIHLNPEKHIQFQFHFQAENEGYSTQVDIPSQRVMGITPKSTTFSNGELQVDMSNLGMVYHATYNPETIQLVGKVTEGPNSFELNLTRGKSELPVGPTRPQEPSPPYPYREEQVVVDHPEAGITLSGTLTLPDSKGPFPAVILISGSGPQDRDETLAKHKPFWVLADYLTRQGIAVLRYDDRGVGKSTGDHSLATTEDFAMDALHAVRFLSQHAQIDSLHIGLIGHSEGAIIAPMVANRSTTVAFMVLLAGTGIPGSEVSLMQSIAFRPFPVPDEEAYAKAIREAIAIAGSSKELPQINAELTQHYQTHIRPILLPIVGSEAQVNQMITQLIEVRTTPWIRYFYHYNPADELEKVKCPVLSLNGSKDVQVPAQINQEGIRKALAKGGNTDVEIRELQGLNHLFQTCETGAMEEYSQIEETMAPKVLEMIAHWVKAQVK